MAKATEGIIQLKHVTLTHKLGGEVIYALNDVSFDVEDGGYVAITGPSGSGKSTLVNVIGGLATPDEGTVTVDGHNIANLSDDKLSSYRKVNIGFVYQSFNLIDSYTALENVMIPLTLAGLKPAKRKEIATKYLKQVGLEHRLNHKPAQLSSGQQQLTAIARALVTEPKILIADEPTGNLDSVHSGEIWQTLGDINKRGTTVLVVTHDANMAHLAKRIVQMSDGKLTELAG